MALIPNVAEFYVLSDGNILQPSGTTKFHAQSNYANLIVLYIEDGLTTNSAASNPLNFTVPENTIPSELVLYGGGTSVIEATLPLNTPIPVYTGGDGAYFVRGIKLNSVEV